MQTIKPIALCTSSRPIAIAGGRTKLVVTAMAGFEMMGASAQLCSEQTLWKALSTVLPAKTSPDLGSLKPRSEWLAFGAIYPATRDAVSAKARVEVTRAGKVITEKQLHVSGARVWQSKAGIAWPSEPGALEGPVLLTWPLAFGGKGHSVNPTGIGLYEDGWLGKPLPYLENFNQLISSPDDRPEPAGFGPLPLDAPNRFKPHGTYDDKWFKNDYPALASDTSPDIFMVGPKDQWLDGVFLPGDQFTCEGMSADGNPLRWQLPAWQPRCLIRRTVTGNQLIPIDLKFDTVWLVPHEGLLAMMWRGEIDITEYDAADVSLLFAALEDLDAPRSLDYYQQQLALRETSQKDAALAALDDSPLLPSGQIGSLLVSAPPEARARIEQARKTYDDAMVKVDALKSPDPTQIPISEQGEEPKPLTPPEESVTIANEITDILLSPKPDAKRLAELIKRARELGLAARKLAMEKVKAVMAEQVAKQATGAAPPAKDPLAGPPVRKFKRMVDQLNDAVAKKMMSPAELEQMQPSLLQVLQAGVVRYRRSAHMMPEGGALADPKELGDHIASQALLAAPVLPAGSDWVGADLSGKNLDGINLAGVFLDGANFSGASMVGANLSDATFARANFSNVDLSKANMAGANLGRANFTSAKLDGANLTKAVLDYAVLQDVSLVGAVLEKATLIGVHLRGVDLSGSNMNECKFIGLKTEAGPEVIDEIASGMPSLDSQIEPIDFGQVDATGVSLHRGLLLGCRGQKVKFSGVDLLRASLAHTEFLESDFTNANFQSTNVVLDSSLARSNFQGARLTASFFREVDLSVCDMRGADLSNSNFGLANMTSVNAVGAQAGGARFERTELKQATFASAQLTGALFMGASLTRTNFMSADLTHADFSKSNSEGGTSFADATILHTKLPKEA